MLLISSSRTSSITAEKKIDFKVNNGGGLLSSVILFLARLLILIKKGGLLQLKFGVVGVGVGVNIYLWAR